MSLLENNLSALKKIAPAVAQKLVHLQNNDTLPVTLTPVHDELHWHYQNTTGNFPLSQAGFVTLNPEQHLIVLYGVGDGRYLEHVRTLKDAYHILVFEPSLTLFRDLLTHRDLTHLLNDEKISFIVGADKKYYLNELEEYFSANALRYYYAGYFGNLATPGIQKIPNYQPAILDFAEHFKKAINNYTVKIRNEPPEDAFRGFMNSIKNRNVFSEFPTLTQFRGACQGLPGIVIGSGPSLEFSIPYLRELQDKVLLFSCDSTLKILLRHGIHPHFVGVLERSIVQADLLTDVKLEDSPILVAPSITHPLVFTTHRGQILSVRRDVGFDEWLFPDSERLYLGRFVSHLGLSSLAVLGCSEICLVGMDSAYAPPQPGQSFDERVYGKLATDHMKKMANEVLEPHMRDRYNFEVPGYDGTLRSTNYYWYTFANTYGEILDEYKVSNAKNVMPITYGIPIAKTERVDPDYLKKFQNISPLKFDHFLDKMKTKTRSADDVKKIMQDTHAQLKSISAACHDGANRLGEFFADNDPSLKDSVPRYIPFFNQIEAYRHSIMTGHDAIFEKLLLQFVMNHHALMEHNLRKVYTTTTETHKILETQVSLYIDWFHNVATWAQRVQRYMEQCGYHGT